LDLDLGFFFIVCLRNSRVLNKCTRVNGAKKMKKKKKKGKGKKGEGVTFCKGDKTFLFVFLSHTSHPFYILQHKHKVGIQFLKECYGKTQNAPHNGKQNSKSHYTILNVKTFT